MKTKFITIELEKGEVQLLIGLLSATGLYQATGDIRHAITLIDTIASHQNIIDLSNNFIEVAKNNGFGESLRYIDV